MIAQIPRHQTATQMARAATSRRVRITSIIMRGGSLAVMVRFPSIAA
jgi:hypothetical protein